MPSSRGGVLSRRKFLVITCEIILVAMFFYGKLLLMIRMWLACVMEVTMALTLSGCIA